MVVFVSSPYAGDIKRNTENAISHCATEIALGNTPYAPHLFFPAMLDEDTDRETAIELGLSMLERCDELHVYGKPTSGMIREIDHALANGIRVVRITE